MEQTGELTPRGRQMLVDFMEGRIDRRQLADQLAEHLIAVAEQEDLGADEQLYIVDLVLEEIADGFRDDNELVPAIQQLLSEASPINS